MTILLGRTELIQFWILTTIKPRDILQDIMSEIPSSFGLRQADITPAMDTVDTLIYIDELYGKKEGEGRISEFIERTRGIPVGEPGSAADVRVRCNFWRNAREDRELSIYDMAAYLGLHVNTLRYVEAGIGRPGEVGDENVFRGRYAEALGDPSLVTQYQQRFPSNK